MHVQQHGTLESVCLDRQANVLHMVKWRYKRNRQSLFMYTANKMETPARGNIVVGLLSGHGRKEEHYLIDVAMRPIIREDIGRMIDWMAAEDIKGSIPSWFYMALDKTAVPDNGLLFPERLQDMALAARALLGVRGVLRTLLLLRGCVIWLMLSLTRL